MAEKWVKLEEKMLFVKYGRGMKSIRYQLPDGRKEYFYIKHEEDFVRIFALTKDKKIIAVRRFLPGPAEITVDLPAGYIRKEESVLSAAARELMQEAGYKGRLKIIAKTFSDGYTDVKGYVVVATDCKKVLENPPETKTEFLEVFLLPIREARQKIKRGAEFSCDTQAWYLGLDHQRLL